MLKTWFGRRFDFCESFAIGLFDFPSDQLIDVLVAAPTTCHEPRVCLSVWLSVKLSDCLSLSVCLSVCLSVRLSVSVYLYVRPSVRLASALEALQSNSGR